MYAWSFQEQAHNALGLRRRALKHVLQAALQAHTPALLSDGAVYAVGMCTLTHVQGETVRMPPREKSCQALQPLTDDADCGLAKTVEDCKI
jgi:hypothetical protein